MKVLISSRSFGEAGTGAIEMLKNAGLNPLLNPYGRKLEESELLELTEGAVGIIAGTERITRKVIGQAKSLRVISRFGVGLDNIDLDAAKDFGIVVCSTPDAPTQAVAELALALILNLSRRICEMDRSIQSGAWKPQMGNLLSGKTIGIVGLGRIGKELLRLIEPFDLRVLAHEPYPDEEFVSRHGIELVSLTRLVSQSDIISLHVPLTAETCGMIGKDELSNMKKHTLLINTARGGLIDENALVAAIEKQSIGGVAIDAFEIEPYVGRLMEFNNVILTPHIGSYTQETRRKMELEAVENMINALAEVNTI